MQRFRTIFKDKNNIIRVINDLDNCLLFFLGCNGKSKSLCYDDNMYYPRDDYYAVCDMLDNMVANEDITQEDYDKVEKQFVKWLKKELKDDEYINDEEIEGWRKEYADNRKGAHWNAKEQLQDLYRRLVDDYNDHDTKPFDQHEEDRLVVHWYLTMGVD